MRTVFITFANTEYQKPDRILQESLDFPFDERIWYTEHDIPEFIEKHQHFINRFPIKYGYHIWKAYIIHKTLAKMNENDILIYADMGMHLNKNGLPRYHEYKKMLMESNKSFVVFNTNDSYTVRQFVKADAYMFYYPEIANTAEPYLYSGIMMIKNNPISRKITDEFLALCENYILLLPCRSLFFFEHQDFRGNDMDNGLFAMCMYKHKEHVHFIYPDEANIYTKNNSQVGHEPNYKAENYDWSSLDSSPFQCRRDRIKPPHSLPIVSLHTCSCAQYHTQKR